MKAAELHPEAKAEIAHETLYYTEVSSVLASRFVKAVEDAVALASEFPSMGVKYKYGTRRYFPKKFPFSVVYIERKSTVFVLALAPFSKKPGYWRARRNDA